MILGSSRFLAAALLLVAANTSAVPAAVAEGAGRPIKNIYACAPSEIVVEFEESSGMPNTPHILDLPGPNHRVVIDFADAIFEEGVISDPETISNAVNHVLPNVKAVHYSNINSDGKPVARLVLDLDQSEASNPSVIEMALGQVTVSLADRTAVKYPQAHAFTKTPAQSASRTQSTAMDSPATASAALQTTLPAANPQATVGFAGAASQAMSTDVAPLSSPAEADVTTSSGKNSDTAGGAASGAFDSRITTTAFSKNDQPNDPGDRALEALKRYNIAVKLHLVGKLGDAVTEYQNALALNPQLSEAHSNLGLVYNQQHNYAQALSEFRKALSINPHDAITYNGIGAALRAEKDLPGAIKNWETAVELDPHLATASYNLGTAYELQKEYDRAIKAYEQAVKNDYRLGEAYYRIGLIMERQHRFQEATREFEQALKVSGNAEYSEDARQRLAFLEQNKKISKR